MRKNSHYVTAEQGGNSPKNSGGSGTRIDDPLFSVFREKDGERGFRGVHAAGIVAAEGNNDSLVLGAIFFIGVFAEGLAAGEAGRSLRHRGAGRIEAAERQDVDFAQQVHGRSRGELFFQSLVRDLATR